MKICTYTYFFMVKDFIVFLNTIGGTVELLPTGKDWTSLLGQQKMYKNNL